MSLIARAIADIQRAQRSLGSVELARRSGVPYSTLKEAEKRAFSAPAVRTLEKLAIAAAAHLTPHHAAPDGSPCNAPALGGVMPAGGISADDTAPQDGGSGGLQMTGRSPGGPFNYRESLSR